QSSAGTDYWVAGVGATYNWEAWTVGLAWSHGDYEYTPSNDNDTIDIIEFTGRYDLGPGISLDSMVGYNDMNAGSNTGHQSDKTYPPKRQKAWGSGGGFFYRVQTPPKPKGCQCPGGAAKAAPLFCGRQNRVGDSCKPLDRFSHAISCPAGLLEGERKSKLRAP